MKRERYADLNTLKLALMGAITTTWLALIVEWMMLG